MLIRESFFRDLLRLIVWYPVRWAVVILPVDAGLCVLRMMGDIHRRFSGSRKQTLRRNLALMGIEGENEKDAITAFFRNHYVDRLLIWIFPKINLRKIRGLLEVKGLSHLNAALARGHGAILVHGHLGPVHLPLVALALMGYPMKQIGNPTDAGLSPVGRNVAFRLRLFYEKRLPTEIVQADAFLRWAFRWLKENGVIMVTGDGTGTERRIGRHRPFRFFGRQVPFPLGPALLSARSGAALLPLFLVPGEEMPYRVVIEPPFYSELTGDEWAEAVTGHFVTQLERRIRACPGHMHFLDRF